MSAEGASYRDAGVDYDALDAAKRLAMLGRCRPPRCWARGGRALDASRGEPAFVFELGEHALALVLEGLGTKSLSPAPCSRQGVNRFADVAYDAIAAILNDLVCVGALPLVVNAYFATGDSAWYEHRERSTALLEGWRRGCEDAGCVWGGGESPSLPGMSPGRRSSSPGRRWARPGGRRTDPRGGARRRRRDRAGRLQRPARQRGLARAAAGRAPAQGYATRWAEVTFGEALLDPTVMYVGLVAELMRGGVAVSYLSHVTGHGLLKLMRPSASFTYRITGLPEVPPVLPFLASEAAWTRPRPTRPSTWASATPSTAGRGRPARCVGGQGPRSDGDRSVGASRRPAAGRAGAARRSATTARAPGAVGQQVAETCRKWRFKLEGAG